MTDPTNTLGAVAIVAAFLTLLGAAALVERHRNNRRDALPMWPVTPRADCGADAHVEIEGRPLCAGHAAGFGLRESEGGR